MLVKIYPGHCYIQDTLYIIAQTFTSKVKGRNCIPRNNSKLLVQLLPWHNVLIVPPVGGMPGYVKDLNIGDLGTHTQIVKLMKKRD